MSILNIVNPYKAVDKITEKLETKKQKEDSKLTDIDQFDFSTEYDKTGKLDYLLFKTKKGSKTKISLLRLFRVKSVCNEVRKKINNEEAFKNILNSFRKPGHSFVVLYAYEPMKSMVISYGILMEGYETELQKLESESLKSIKTLEKQFRSNYNNIEIVPLTHNDSWIFEKFYAKYVTVVRGIPKTEGSFGRQTGTSPYDPSTQASRQISETILKGMTARIDENDIAMGDSFLMYAVLEPLSQEEIQRGLEIMQRYLSKSESSIHQTLSENENFSLPIMFGFGLGEMFGHTNGTTDGASHAVGDAHSQTATHTAGHTDTDTNGDSSGKTHTATEQHASAHSKTDGKGGNVGASALVQDTWNWSQQKGDTKSTSDGTSDGFSDQISHSHANANSASDSLGKGDTHTNTETKTTSNSVADSSQKGQNMSGAGGVNIGDGSGLTRQIKDNFEEFAALILKLNEMRYQTSKRDGMFDYRMMVFTEDEEAKMTVEELIKQAYTDNQAPLPIRIPELSKEEQKVMNKYAKSMTKPDAKETREGLPEKNHFSTYITPYEATAFSLPQDNLPGYDSSYDPIPETMAHLGEMEEGATIGKQWDRNLNKVSGHHFNIPKRKLGHIGIFGGTGQGKTVFVQRFISEINNKFGINVLLFDWTKNHRSLITQLNDAQRFRFNSFDPKLFPFKVNLLALPKGVPGYVWDPIISELFCYSTGLGGRSYLIIIQCLDSLRKRLEKIGKEPTILDLIDEVAHELEDRTEAAGGRLGFKEQETFSSMRDRFELWTRENRPSFESFCKGPFMAIDELVKGNFVHLIECAKLPGDARKFVINGISAAIFQYCAHREEKLPNPTYMVFEEAHTVLGMPTGDEPLPINETIFEIMSREARNYNLFIGYVCQSPEKLPELIFDNLPIRVVFQLPDEVGKSKLVSAAGKDPNRLDVDLVKWLSTQPRGTCVVRMSSYEHLKEGQFVAVKVDMLKSEEMKDDFFRKLCNKKSIK